MGFLALGSFVFAEALNLNRQGEDTAEMGQVRPSVSPPTCTLQVYTRLSRLPVDEYDTPAARKKLVEGTTAMVKIGIVGIGFMGMKAY
jgi:hypothetical protein